MSETNTEGMTDPANAAGRALADAKAEYAHELDAIDRWHLNSLTDAAGDYIALLEAALAQANRQREAATRALKSLAEGDAWMEHERISSHNICHYCGERFNGWTTSDTHKDNCPVLIAQQLLTANAADDAGAGAEGE
jgi:hypothetical protein